MWYNYHPRAGGSDLISDKLHLLLERRVFPASGSEMREGLILGSGIRVDCSGTTGMVCDCSMTEEPRGRMEDRALENWYEEENGERDRDYTHGHKWCFHDIVRLRATHNYSKYILCPSLTYQYREQVFSLLFLLCCLDTSTSTWVPRYIIVVSFPATGTLEYHDTTLWCLPSATFSSCLCPLPTSPQSSGLFFRFFHPHLSTTNTN